MKYPIFDQNSWYISLGKFMEKTDINVDAMIHKIIYHEVSHGSWNTIYKGGDHDICSGYEWEDIGNTTSTRLGRPIFVG